MPTPQRAAQFWTIHLVPPLVLLAVAVVVFQFTDVDRALIEPWFDRAARCFPRNEDPFYREVLHKGGKYGVIAVGVALTIALGLTWRRPALRPWRRHLIYVLLCLAIVPTTVAIWKSVSWKHCPWDVDEYGGYAPFVHLLDPPVAGIKPGHGFPGGHASGGFALLSIYFALRVRRPDLAPWGIVVGLVYGAFLSWTRMVMGAHFVSHNVVSAFVGWFLCLALYQLVLRRADERGTAQ